MSEPPLKKSGEPFKKFRAPEVGGRWLVGVSVDQSFVWRKVLANIHVNGTYSVCSDGLLLNFVLKACLQYSINPSIL